MKYIIDLDGTLLDGANPNLDSVEFVNELQNKNCEFVVMTNSVKSPNIIKERLSNVGIEIGVEKIINPIIAMNIYVQRNNLNSAYVIGSKLEKGQVTVEPNETNPDVVLLLDFEKDNFGYKELQKIFDYMEDDIPVITASRSKFYLKNGSRQLDTGAFVSLLETVTGEFIEVIGKPSKNYFESAIEKLGTVASDVTVIGDDWQTDILGAVEVGCHAILLKSGKYSVGDEENAIVKESVDKLMEIFVK